MKRLLLFLLFVNYFLLHNVAAQELPMEMLDTSSKVNLSLEAANDSLSYREKKISLDFRAVDIIDVLKFIALRGGINIIPSPGVTGRINLFLKNVTIEEVLDVILEMNKLACIKESNVIKIMTEAEYAAVYGDIYHKEKAVKIIKLKYATPSQVNTALSQLKSVIGKIIIDPKTGTVILIDVPEKIELLKKTIESLDQPLITKVYQLRYGDVKEIQSKFAAYLTEGAGHVEYDERTGKLVVTDLPIKMEQIEELIKQFDEKSREVLIEAKIAQVILNDEHQQGINWSYLASTNDSKLHEIKLASPFKATSSDILSLAKTESYSAVLQLLNSTGETKILSSPRITTLNGKEARILIGTKEVYVTLSAGTTSSTTLTPTSETVQFIEVGVKLYVTPIINENGFVTMKVRPEVSSVTGTVTSPLGSKIPIVGTTEAETSVMIKDGITLVIGGLMKDEKIETRAGIPFLKDIPIIGMLFGRKSYEIKKTELIIFLTPHIVTGDINVLSFPEGNETILDGKELKGLEENGTVFDGKDLKGNVEMDVK